MGQCLKKTQLKLRTIAEMKTSAAKKICVDEVHEINTNGFKNTYKEYIVNIILNGSNTLKI